MKHVHWTWTWYGGLKPKHHKAVGSMVTRCSCLVSLKDFVKNFHIVYGGLQAYFHVNFNYVSKYDDQSCSLQLFSLSVEEKKIIENLLAIIFWLTQMPIILFCTFYQHMSTYQITNCYLIKEIFEFMINCQRYHHFWNMNDEQIRGIIIIYKWESKMAGILIRLNYKTILSFIKRKMKISLIAQWYWNNPSILQIVPWQQLTKVF